MGVALAFSLRNVSLGVRTEAVLAVTSGDSFRTTVGKYAELFDDHQSKFMARLWGDSRAQYQSHLSNLCTRLDYNGYFAAHMDVHHPR
jgi:hypothetical protein